MVDYQSYKLIIVYALSALAAYVSFHIAANMRQNHIHQRSSQFVVGAVAIGVGVISAHFILMHMYVPMEPTFESIVWLIFSIFMAFLSALMMSMLLFLCLAKALLASEVKHREKPHILQEDLKAAAHVQTCFLPQPTLSIPCLQFSWAYLPYHLVGGDLFNAIKIDDRHVVFYILDVSGHDVTSSLVTISISQFLAHQGKNLLMETLSPKQLLTALDNEYPMDRFNKYFTIFVSILDVQTGILRYSNGGHPPAILANPDEEIQLLSCGGTIIGIGVNSQFDEEEKHIENGGKLILYTDGLVDFCNEQGEAFGPERLYTLIEGNKQESVKDIETEFRRQFREFGINVNSCWQDDVSFFCIERYTRKESGNHSCWS
jgi:sigma-B regulation protein RsbU (phosphoserine phosphatase)